MAPGHGPDRPWVHLKAHGTALLPRPVTDEYKTSKGHNGLPGLVSNRVRLDSEPGVSLLSYLTVVIVVVVGSDCLSVELGR